MSEETCVSQFQHLVKTKFEEGGVEELLHLLKSGGQDDVLVNQLAEYLMTQDIDFQSEDEAFSFSEKLSDPDGTVSVTSIQNGIDIFIANHKEADMDEEDFNFTADSLMKGNENIMDDGESNSLQSGGNMENGEDYRPTSSITPPPLSPFPESQCRSATTDDQDEDQDGAENLNDVSMLSDDADDSRPSSPSRVFQPPPSRHSGGKKRIKKRQNGQREDNEDLSLDDENDNSDEDANDASVNDSISDNNEDESDNSSIDTDGMKHSQTVDSENFFFCPEPEPTPELEIRPDKREPASKTGLSMVEEEPDNTLTQEQEKGSESTMKENNQEVLNPDNTKTESDNAPDVNVNVEGEVAINVGLSLTALPRQLNVAPHPITNTLMAFDDEVDSGPEGSTDLAKARVDLEVVTSDMNAQNTDNAGKEMIDADEDRSTTSRDDHSRSLESQQKLKQKQTQENISPKSALHPPKPSSFCVSLSSVGDASEVTLPDSVEEQDEIVGLWQKHPVRHKILTQNKERVRAFGRTSYEEMKQSCPPRRLVYSNTPSHWKPTAARCSRSGQASNMADSKGDFIKDRKQSKKNYVKNWDVDATSNSKHNVQQEISAGKNRSKANFSEKSSAKRVHKTDEAPISLTTCEDKTHAVLSRSDSKCDSSYESRYEELPRHEPRNSDGISHCSLNSTRTQETTIKVQSAETDRKHSGKEEQQNTLPFSSDHRWSFTGDYTKGSKSGQIGSAEGASRRLSMSRTATGAGIGSEAFKKQCDIEDHVHLLKKKVENLSNMNVNVSQSVQKMDRVLEDKSRLIDDVILNEMDYLHRHIDKLQAYKSKSIKEINSLREFQKNAEHRMEVKFRDFEMKENARITEYVKSSLDKESRSRAVLNKRKGITSVKSSPQTITGSKDIKSSGYGYDTSSSKENKQLYNVKVTSDNRDECIKESKSVITPNSSVEKKDSSSETHVGDVSSSNGDVNVKNKCSTNKDTGADKEDPVPPQHSQSVDSMTANKKPASSTPNSRTLKSTNKNKTKLLIVNDRVKKSKAPLSFQSPQIRDKNAPYLVKNPRERIVDFRFEESLRGSGDKDKVGGDAKDMEFALRVHRRRQLQEKKRQAVMISKRVCKSCGDDDLYEQDDREYYCPTSIPTTTSASSSSLSLSASSSSWWSDLMARKEEAERKGFLAILGNDNNFG